MNFLRCPAVHCGLWLVALAGLPEGLQAQTFGAGFGVVSDKVAYGVSQTAGRPSVVAYGDVRADSGWAAALNVSSLHHEVNGLDAEWVATALHEWQPDPAWSVQLAGTHFGYVGNGTARDVTRDQAAVSLNWAGRVDATLSYSPNTPVYATQADYRLSRRSAGVWVAELNGHQRVVSRLALDVGLGWRQLNPPQAGMAYGSVGLGWREGPARLSLTFIDSRAAQRLLLPASALGPRWVSALLFDF